jgi:hypothetical protein
MPVEACRLIELVDEPDFDLLAFFETQERAGDFAVKTPDVGFGGRLGQKLQTPWPLRGHGNRQGLVLPARQGGARRRALAQGKHGG